MDAGKWDLILHEAANAFSRFGFRKASIDDIARAAGVAKGTIYLGCTSKLDLFYQAILRDIRLWNADLAPLVDPRTPADETLARVAMAAFDTVRDHPLAQNLITNVYAADLPDFVERLDELRAEGLSLVRDILRIGVRQGRFRKDVDLDAAAGILLDLITTTMMFHAHGPDGEEGLMRHAIAVNDLILKGLLARD
jgi:AcrR family transcriptional regulator